LRSYARDLEEWRKAQEADLASARVTQRAIIPAKFPDLPGWKFEARFEPLIQVGGDIYGWQKLPDGSWLVWLADGTGHGATAALLTVLTAHLFRKGCRRIFLPWRDSRFRES
jgi:serine phosphatase RsbU (regulator of sigma subunit)